VRGSELRALREEQGRSLADVAEATGIALDHLEALEQDRLDDLPPGPYAAAYERTLRRYFGLPNETTDGRTDPAGGRTGAPLWVVRALAITSIVALVVLLVVSGRERAKAVLGSRRAADGALDQHLVVVARETTHLVIRADGRPVLDREVAGGEELVFDARDSLELEVPRVSDVSLQWNGDQLVPQGRQDAPRTIVLVDDEDGG
jgi:transcriptional regulator with XRE-family HTH domain